MARCTKQEAQITRERLLDAAERVFEARGVARTSLAEIAQAAGVTRGALYWHFKDKAALFGAMMTRATGPLEVALLVRAPSPQASAPQGADEPIERLWQGLVESVRLIVEDERTRRVLRISMLMREHGEELIDAQRELERARAEALAHTTDCLRAGAARRGVALPAWSPDAAQVCARGLHALAFGLVHAWLMEGMTTDLRTDLARTAGAYLYGLGLAPQAVAHAARADRG